MSGTIINYKLEGNAEGNLYDYGATTISRYVTEGETVLYTVESPTCKLGNISGHIMFSLEEHRKWQVSFSHLSL